MRGGVFLNQNEQLNKNFSLDYLLQSLLEFAKLAVEYCEKTITMMR
jgi:hypothetical protein